MSGMKDELIDLLCEKSVKCSDEPIFKLVSGRMSRFYANCKPVTLHPRGMYLIGHLMMEALGDTQVAGIGGLTFGADPIANAVAYTSGLLGRPIKAFSIRKTQKDHGIVKWIEGDVTRGDRVTIIDDVATTGGSTIKAIERAREEGLDVVSVIILVNRQEGGLGAIQELVPNTCAITTKSELLARWHEING